MQGNVRHTKCFTFEQQTFVEGLIAVHGVRGDFLFTSPLSRKIRKTVPLIKDDQSGWSFQAAQESKVAREALLDWAQDRRGTWYRRRHCIDSDSIKQMIYDDWRY